MLRRQLLIAAIALATMTGAARAETGLRLLMVEQPGCSYCAAWHAEVGPEYPKTAEGMAAPLITSQLRDGPPDGVTLTSTPVFTPTFVLLRDNQEIARLEGYPGEDFFWGLLGQMLRDAGAEVN